MQLFNVWLMRIFAAFNFLQVHTVAYHHASTINTIKCEVSDVQLYQDLIHVFSGSNPMFSIIPDVAKMMRCSWR